MGEKDLRKYSEYLLLNQEFNIVSRHSRLTGIGRLKMLNAKKDSRLSPHSGGFAEENESPPHSGGFAEENEETGPSKRTAGKRAGMTELNKLLSGLMVLCFFFCSIFTVADAAETIIDNRDAATSRVGSWYVSSGTGSIGVDSLFARKDTAVTPTFTWHFTPSQSGNYQVSVWWTYRDSRSTSVPIEIDYDGGTANFVVNQLQNGSTWNLFGTYYFQAGVTYRVTVTAQPIPTSASTTCADAVKFASVDSPTTYTITATAGSGGSISPSGNVSVQAGADQTFTMTANPGYHVADVVVDGGSVGAVPSHTFPDVTSNHTIAATFAPDSPTTYTITATAGSGGSISPSGNVSVQAGADQTFTMTANPGYHVADVVVDGGSVGAVPSYTFPDVISNHTIAATFAPDTPTQETIIDNRDATTSRVGTWSVSSGSGSIGVDSLFARKTTSVTPTFTWHFTPSQSGNYQVSVWWTYRDSRSTSVPIDIEHAGSTASLVVNQKLNGSTWNLFGTYYFQAGVTYRVTVTAQPIPTSASTTCADAVRFVYVGGTGNTPPVAVIDSISPNPAQAGQTVTFTGHGTDSDGDDITGFSWRLGSSGLSTEASFSTSALPTGTHVIYFKVKDSRDAWSSEVNLLIGHLGCDFPVRIMPMGDSITYGTYGTGEPRPQELITGYRQPLNQSLIDAGYSVDFVGSLQTGQSVLPFFDYDHEGHPGWHAKGATGGGLAPNIVNWLTLNPADIVLLHIGTNDISGGDQNVAEISEILDNIDLYNKDILVVLAKIINRTDNKSDETTEFNNAVETMARTRITNGDKIILVNQENALLYPDDMWDAVHPNDAGYNKMAQVWYAALSDVLPVCEQIPLSFISSHAGSGGSVSPSGAIPVRYGADQTFAITADPTFRTVDVIVDGNSVGVTPSYTFPSVTVDHMIEAIFAPFVPPGEIVIDNRDAATSWTGSWYVSSGSGSIGADSVFARKETTGAPAFTWHFTAPQSGNYQVSMWWTYRDSRSTSVPIDIEYSGGTARIVVNQKLNGSTWNDLGIYYFEAGMSYGITVTAQPIPTSSSTTCADAVRFIDAGQP